MNTGFSAVSFFLPVRHPRPSSQIGKWFVSFVGYPLRILVQNWTVVLMEDIKRIGSVQMDTGNELWHLRVRMEYPGN